MTGCCTESLWTNQKYGKCLKLFLKGTIYQNYGQQSNHYKVRVSELEDRAVVSDN